MISSLNDFRKNEALRKELSAIATNPHFQQALLILQLYFTPGKIPLQSPKGMDVKDTVLYHQGFLEGAQRALNMLEQAHLLAPKPPTSADPKGGDPEPYWGMSQPIV